MGVKRIILTENQFKRIILKEGYSLSPVDDHTLNMTFDNNDMSDKANKMADTRLFGTRNDVLNGDASSNGKNTLMQKKLNAQIEMRKNSEMISILKSRDINGIDHAKFLNDKDKEKLHSIDFSDDEKVKEEISNIEEKNYKLNTSLSAYSSQINQASNLYQSVNSDATGTEDERISRFFVGEVPNSEDHIKYIALFTVNSFSVNSALKHGYLNANQETLYKLRGNVSKADYMNDTGKENINAVFDNKLKGTRAKGDKYSTNQSTIAQLFSQKGFEDSSDGESDHYRQNYGLGDAGPNGYGNVDNKYTTANEFIDKSIMYSAYALRKVNFQPRIIIAAPSSSSYNKYYCQRLASVINAQFVDNFFKQSLLTTKFDEEGLRNAGMTLTPSQRQKIDTYALLALKRGINVEWSNMINSFNKSKGSSIYTIALSYGLSQTEMQNEISDYFKRNLSQYLKERGNNTAEYIATYLIENKSRAGFSRKNKEGLNSFFSNKKNINDFSQTLAEAEQLFEENADKLNNGTMNITLNDNQLKITGIEGRFRQYLKNMYIVATDELKKSGNRSIGYYRNSNTLIFDDDMGSGTTLKLTIDGLKNFKDDLNAENTMCLVNSFSFAGK